MFKYRVYRPLSLTAVGVTDNVCFDGRNTTLTITITTRVESYFRLWSDHSRWYRKDINKLDPRDDRQKKKKEKKGTFNKCLVELDT